MSDLFGTSQGTIQTQGSNTPWAGVAPYLTDIFSRGQNLYNQNQSPSPFTQQAWQMAANTANSPNSLTAQAQGQLGNTISGQYLNPNSNPYFASGLNDTLGLVKSQIAGQYGGLAGQNLGNSGYQENLARGLGGVASQAYSGLYNTERGNQMNALGMAPYLDYARSGALGNIGSQQQAFPWQQLAGYQQSLVPGLGFNQTTGQQPYYQNNTLGTLGAGAAGLGAYLAFSDRRLKVNVVRIGEDPRGFGIYEYDLFGERQRGVMADEVEKIIPEAVSESHGFKVVDYWRLQ